jgi:hypothetical protein
VSLTQLKLSWCSHVLPKTTIHHPIFFAQSSTLETPIVRPKAKSSDIYNLGLFNDSLMFLSGASHRAPSQKQNTTWLTISCFSHQQNLSWITQYKVSLNWSRNLNFNAFCIADRHNMSEIAERIYNCKVTSKVTKTNARHGLLSGHQFDPYPEPRTQTG